MIACRFQIYFLSTPFENKLQIKCFKIISHTVVIGIDMMKLSKGKIRSNNKGKFQKKKTIG